MTQIKIIPKYINAAAAGKKYGSVALADRTRYLVKPEHIGAFTTGVEIEIDVRAENWGSGPVQIATPVAHQHAPTPSPALPQNGNGHTNGNGNKDEHIFVCGIVNNWMGGVQGRKPSTQDIIDVTNAARDAYRQTLGAK